MRLKQRVENLEEEYAALVEGFCRAQTDETLQAIVDDRIPPQELGRMIREYQSTQAN